MSPIPARLKNRRGPHCSGPRDHRQSSPRNRGNSIHRKSINVIWIQNKIFHCSHKNFHKFTFYRNSAALPIQLFSNMRNFRTSSSKRIPVRELNSILLCLLCCNFLIFRVITTTFGGVPEVDVFCGFGFGRQITRINNGRIMDFVGELHEFFQIRSKR